MMVQCQDAILYIKSNAAIYTVTGIWAHTQNLGHSPSLSAILIFPQRQEGRDL